MKSMQSMQEEIFSKARFDGGWPRAVLVGVGCVALAHNQKEYDSLRRDNAVGWIVGAVLSIIIIVCCAVYLP